MKKIVLQAVGLGGLPTVAGVTTALTKTLEDLEKVRTAHLEEATRQSDLARETADKATASRLEASNAKRIAQNIGALLNPQD